MQQRRRAEPREHERGAVRDRAGRQVGVEREVPAPGLVDDERGPVAVRDGGEQRDVGHRAVEGGRHDDRGARAGRGGERRVEARGRDAVGDAGDRVELGREPVRVEPGDDEPGDRGRVHVALDHDLAAAGGVQGEAGGDVRLAALGERPGASGAPRLGGALEGIPVGRPAELRRRRPH